MDTLAPTEAWDWEANDERIDVEAERRRSVWRSYLSMEG